MFIWKTFYLSVWLSGAPTGDPLHFVRKILKSSQFSLHWVLWRIKSL